MEGREEGVPLVFQLHVREETQERSGTDSRLIRRTNTRCIHTSAVTQATTAPGRLVLWCGCTYINTWRGRIELVLWQWRRGWARGSWRGTLVQQDAAGWQAVLPQVPASAAEVRAIRCAPHFGTCEEHFRSLNLDDQLLPSLTDQLFSLSNIRTWNANQCLQDDALKCYFVHNPKTFSLLSQRREETWKHPQ